MANVKTFVATLGLAGAVLIPVSASFAQQYVRQAIVAPVVVDCYYDIVGTCGSYGYVSGNGAYGTSPIGGGPFAAVGLAAPAYTAPIAPNPYGWGRLSPTDLIGVHGANAN